ncbi:MAG: nucleotidyltransferase domain-containing protein [Myxococcota bacterium]
MTADAILTQATQRIAQRFAPVQVVLFGSRAWGTPDAQSDFDLAVIVPDGSDVRRLMREIRRELASLPAAFDVLVFPVSQWRKWSASGVTLEHRIARDGRVVFDAAA